MENLTANYPVVDGLEIYVTSPKFIGRTGPQYHEYAEAAALVAVKELGGRRVNLFQGEYGVGFYGDVYSGFGSAAIFLGRIEQVGGPWGVTFKVSYKAADKDAWVVELDSLLHERVDMTFFQVRELVGGPVVFGWYRANFSADKTVDKVIDTLGL